jgi:hypothetical protein
MKIGMKTTNIRERLLDRIPAQWGKWVSCDSGWDWILNDLDKKLMYLDFNYKIHQVKEKFGTLRVYYEAQTAKDVVLDLMDDAVRTAELYSSTTCELCGKSSMMSDSSKGVEFDGTVSLKYSNNGNPDGWLKTLCDPCAEPIGYENSKEVW